jgi:uncharacterized membrane protein
MDRFKLIIAIVVMVASMVIIVNKIFSPVPIQITLDSGQEITTESPSYFSLSEVLLLVVCSFLLGASSVYLYYKADIRNNLKSMRSGRKGVQYAAVLPLLKGDERKVMHALIDAGGEMLQNKLVIKLGLTKVKVTRVLSSLQKKKLIVKERHGITNKIILKEIES